MKKNILLIAFLLIAGISVKAQNLHVQCGLGGALQCDGREIVIYLYNPSCGSVIGSTSPLVVWTGDDYIVNLAALWGGPLPSAYEIYAVDVMALSACGLPVSTGGPCYNNGVSVGETICTGLNNVECFTLTANCGPTGGIGCLSGQNTTVTYTRFATGNVLLQID